MAIPLFPGASSVQGGHSSSSDALTDPQFPRKFLTASTFSDDSAGGRPLIRPSAEARSTPALIRSRMVSLSHSARDSSIWSMRRDVGLSSPVSSPSAKERMLMPWLVKLLDRFEPFPEVPRQAVEPRDHHRVPRVEHPAELPP